MVTAFRPLPGSHCVMPAMNRAAGHAEPNLPKIVHPVIAGCEDPIAAHVDRDPVRARLGL